MLSLSFREKLEKTLFQILIFLLPTQFAYHFWPNWAFVGGIRVDYLAPTIYLTDCILIIIFFLWFQEKLIDKKRVKNFSFPAFVLVFLFSLVNILAAQNYQAALFKWIKLYELIFFVYILIDKKKLLQKELIFKPLALAVIFTSVLALIQFFLQKTVGGPFYFFGERSFSASTPGIAKAVYFGKELMRPYSSFPHPNVLAGVTSASTLFLLRIKGNRIIKFLLLTVTLPAVLLSASLGAWVALVIAQIASGIKLTRASFLKKIYLGIFSLAVLTGIFSPLISKEFIKERNRFPDSVLKRAYLNIAAGEMVSKEPFTGVGLNNFVVKIPWTLADETILWYLQPVHNIFLLMFTETGLIGLFIFVIFSWKLIKRSLENKVKTRLYATIFLLIIITGSFDHYWVTLQQSQLLLALFTGLTYR